MPDSALHHFPVPLHILSPNANGVLNPLTFHARFKAQFMGEKTFGDSLHCTTNPRKYMFKLCAVYENYAHNSYSCACFPVSGWASVLLTRASADDLARMMGISKAP